MKFILTAKEKKTPMLFLPSWWIGVLLLVVIVLLYLIFPKNLFTRAIHSSSVSSRRLNYLIAYQVKYPNLYRLRFKAIEMQIQLGKIKHLDMQLLALKKVYQGPNEMLDQDIYWLNYLFAKYQLGKIKHNTKKRLSLLKELRALTLILAKKPLEPQQLKVIAIGALAYGKAPIALEIYTQLLQQNKLLKIKDLDQGALIAMQNNKPEISAIFYEKAYTSAKKIEDKTNYALKTMAAWWASNKPYQALKFGLALPFPIQNQKAIQIYIARLALAQNEPNLAQTYLYRSLDVASKDMSHFEKRLSQILPKDQRLDLLYQASLYSKHLKIAYQVARIALDKNPQSLTWHQRFAQIAIWNNDYSPGVKSWVYVFDHASKNEIRQQAISAIKLLGFDEVLSTLLKAELKRDPQNLELALEWASAQNRLGAPKKALDILDSFFPTFKENDKILSEYYLKKAKIYENMEELDKALAVLRARDKRFGYDAVGVIEQASIYYKQKDLKHAQMILKKGMSNVPEKNQDFWYALATLSWDLNDRKTALTAYKYYKNPQSLMQLIELNRVQSPKDALELSLMGLQQYHLALYLGNALTFISKQNDMLSFVKLLHIMSKEDQIVANKISVYWQLLVKLYGYMHEINLQEELLANAILNYPQLSSLKIDLLWLVLMQGKSDFLRPLLQQWYPEALFDTPEIWYPMAEGFNLENQMDMALFLYQRNLLNKFQDKNAPCQDSSSEDSNRLQALIDYANVLDKVKNNKAAYEVRVSLWNWLLQPVSQIEDPLIRQHLLEQLATYFTSGTTQWWLNMGLLNGGDEQSLSLALNWLTKNHLVDWASWIKDANFLWPIPDRIQLAIALQRNDTQSLQDIQAKPAQTKPRVEHIQAATRLENTAEAETLIFKELTERPDAYEIYQDFVPMLLKDANYGGVAVEEEQFVNIVGPRLKLENRQRLTNAWAIKPKLNIWSVKSQNAFQIVNVPHDTQVGFTLQEKIHRGQIQYTMQYRNALNEFIPFDMELTYQLSSHWQMIFDAGFNQENYQTSYMRIGGVQDQLNAKLIGQIDRYQMLYTEIEALNYYSQNRHYLGDGMVLHGLDTYKFWLSYPDYTFGVFTDLFFLRRNGSFGGNVTNLFPSLNPQILNTPTLLSAEQNLQYQQLVPNSYYQVGAQFSFGDNIQEYSARLRPYFIGRLYYNTLTQLSNDVKCGLVTTVWGHDSLAVYAEHGTAPAVSNATTYKFGIRYRAYY